MEDLTETPGSKERLPGVDGDHSDGKLWLPWTIIAVATLILVFGNIWANRLKEERSVGADIDQLVLLKFQAKTLIGAHDLAAVQGQALDLPGSDLREALPNADPVSLAAIAALENFLRSEADEGQREEILANIDSDLDSAMSDGSDADTEILRTVRAAVADPSSVGGAEWAAIEERLGWFGKLLAASVGGPEQDQASMIRAGSKRIFALWTMGIFLLIGAGIAGAVLLFFAIRENSKGDLQLRLTPVDSGLARGLLECFAVYLGAMAAIELLMLAVVTSGRELPAFVGYGAVFAPVLGALVWGLVFRNSHRGLLRAAGMHRGQGVLKEIGCGFLGYVAILPVVALGIAATVGLTLLVAGMTSEIDGGAPVPISHPIVSEIAKGDFRILLGVLLLASVAAPLFEEALFRGAFHGGMRGRRCNFWISALIGGVIFAAIHPQGLMAIPALAAMGFGFAMLREWRGSLIAPMTAHAFHNGSLVMLMWIVFGG